MRVQKIYAQQVAEGVLCPDAAQEAAVAALSALADALQSVPPRPIEGDFFRWSYRDAMPPSLYLHGPVGRGKSHVMHLFFEALPKNISSRRVHFHAFMEELHQRMHTVESGTGADPVHRIASDIAQKAMVLCFDEFYITNIADAMLLGRFLEKLFQCGVVLITTSNWAPDGLYQDGFNRGKFFPFIKIIQRHMKVLDLGEGTDFRRKNGGELQLYFIKNTSGFTAAAKEREATTKTFAEVCEAPLGRDDYFDLASRCTALALDGVPRLSAGDVNAALRMITLIDIFYEYKRPILINASVGPEDICKEGEASFAFQRTASRLMEMQGW